MIAWAWDVHGAWGGDGERHVLPSPAAKPVTVGWGQKATQFHGSLGKPTTEALKEKVIMASAVVYLLHLWPRSLLLQEVQPATAWDSGQPAISWHGDGEYFAVSAIDPATGK